MSGPGQGYSLHLPWVSMAPLTPIGPIGHRFLGRSFYLASRHFGSAPVRWCTARFPVHWGEVPVQQHASQTFGRVIFGL